MKEPAYYRRKAHELRAMAERVRLQMTKAQLIDIAAQYDALAEQVAELAADSMSPTK
jgi:hypothetical protein